MPGAVSVGFYGKLPARGDFVRAGLPRTFVEPWDGWLASVLAGSRALMGEDWLAAWLEAPVWRFRLGAGICGPDAALGLMLPSVDRVGRYFPLTLAAVFGADRFPPEWAACDAWLDGCEKAARAALDEDGTPDRLQELMFAPDAPGSGAWDGAGLWWTEGSPRVEAGRLQPLELPSAAVFAAMLGHVGEALERPQ